MAQKTTGKASYFQHAGTKIYITKYSPKFDRTQPKTTDSSNYDTTTALVWQAQLPCAMAVTLSVEGNYHLDGNTRLMTAKLLDGSAAAVAVVLGFDAGNLAGSGSFDIKDFEIESVIEGLVTWKATFESNGVFTASA